jgi:hypothetical protein
VDSEVRRITMATPDLLLAIQVILCISGVIAVPVHVKEIWATLSPSYPRISKRWHIWISIPGLWICLVLAFLAQFLAHSEFLRSLQAECGLRTTINPDIGGVGVRAGLYLPGLLTFLSLCIGCWYNEEIGTKEIGSAQLVSKYLASTFWQEYLMIRYIYRHR